MTLPASGPKSTVLICMLSLFLSVFSPAACRRDSGDQAAPPAQSEARPVRDINDVLRDHDDDLMAIPGVVGVYVGLMADEKTPCLKVMAARKTPELDGKVPKLLEGYPVVVEESGIIRPMPRK